MTSSKLFQWTTLVLAVINIALIAFFLFGRDAKRGHDPRDRNQHIIIKELGFDDSQVAQYKLLIHEHQAEISLKDLEIKKAKEALFSLLGEDDQSSKDSLIAMIADNQSEIEKVHFEHFNKIKQLCTKEQLPKFKALTNRLGRMFAPQKGPKPPRD